MGIFYDVGCNCYYGDLMMWVFFWFFVVVFNFFKSLVLFVFINFLFFDKFSGFIFVYL